MPPSQLQYNERDNSTNGTNSSMHIFAKKGLRINESHKSDFTLLLFWGFTAKTFSLRASVQDLLAKITTLLCKIFIWQKDEPVYLRKKQK